MDRRGFVGGALVGLAGLLGLSKAAGAKEVQAEVPAKNEADSPLLDAIQWQMPTKRREIWYWAEYFYDNDPEVARLLDLQQALYLGTPYASDSERLLARDLCVFGNSFWMPGSPDPSRYRLSPYDLDYSSPVPFAGGEVRLLPSAELKQVIWSKQPRSVYDRIPQHVRATIMAGRPVPIEAAHFALRKDASGLGRPRWYSYFRYLVAKQRCMEHAFIYGVAAADLYRKEMEKGNPIAAEIALTEKAFNLRSETKWDGMDQAIVLDLHEADGEITRLSALERRTP